MAIFRDYSYQFEKTKELEFSWDNFRGGLNTLLRESEIGDDELSQASNILLVGKGVPTKRWGTALYYLSNATGSVRGLAGFYQADGTNQLLSITDQGYLTRRSGASYTMITGASWASGYDAYMAQLGDKTYIVNGQREMVRYSNPTLVGFPTIGIPTGVFATQMSGVSGENSYSYRVSAVSNVGETLAAEAVLADNCPQDLLDGAVKVSWTAVSTASGILSGYNVYGRTLGDERFLGGVDATSTAFIDDGTAIPYEFTFPPTSDSTGGINAKFVIRFEDRLVFAGIDDDPSQVIISGKEPHQEKADISFGGNYIRIEPDAGDAITGLGIYRDKIIVFKERSIWQVTLSQVRIGNFFVTIPTATMITGSHGCIAPRSIVPVENDLFFLSSKGVYVLGYEPNIAIDVLRTNELSVKVRPTFAGISTSSKAGAAAAYYDFKYLISFPGTNQTMVFDRERQAWTGPWTTDARVYEVYKDSSNEYHLLYGSDSDPNVIEFDDTEINDQGSVIETRLRTKKFDFGNWSVFKIIKDVLLHFRNLAGRVFVDINLENRSGRTTSAKSFTAQSTSGNSGWGASMWADAQWGDSAETRGTGEIDDVVRWAKFGSGKVARNIQLDIRTTDAIANYELLGVRGTARERGKGHRKPDWQV